MKTFLVMVCVVLCFSHVISQTKKEAKKSPSELPLAAKSNEGRVWGSTFVDYAYLAQTQNPTDKGANEFTIRRIYLGYDQDFSQQFSARILMEADKPDTASNGLMNFYVKHAYVEWKDLVPMSSIFIGLSSTPSLALAEKIWGYRSLEKVILDRNSLITTSDMGVGIRGKLVPGGSFGYAVMVGNGRGGRSENDKSKKLYGEINFEPLKATVVELYADYENNGQGNLLGKGLIGYQVPSVSFGVEWFYRTIQQGAVTLSGTPSDSALMGGSAYTSFQIAENFRWVLRGDYYDRNVLVTDSGLRELFGIVGLDYTPGENMHVIPNVLYTHLLYKAKLPTDPVLKDDITVRLTFAYSFSARVP